MIIDGGDCDFGIESTILDCTKDIPVILREGSISILDIKNCIGNCLYKDASHKNINHPGMDLKHYSPTKPTYLIENDLNIDKFEIIDYRIYDSAKNFAKHLYSALHKLDEDVLVKNIYILNPPNTIEWSAVKERIQRACSSKNNRY
jgi:L-threonylcarbamoyladenylate synthase